MFLTLSGLATGASWLCYFRALQIGDAARVAPIDKLSVVLVALFGVMFLGERLAALNWAGVALIAAGAVLVAWRRSALLDEARLGLGRVGQEAGDIVGAGGGDGADRLGSTSGSRRRPSP